VAAFGLVVAKGGPKLQASTAGKERTAVHFNATPIVARGTPAARAYAVSISAEACPMSRLAELLSVYGPAPVEDLTGLASKYDFTLAWNEISGPALSTAVRDLGLRLQSRRLRVSLFVIESAHMPTEN
jgi:uncharacterized protein (TIGR03435 family)